MSFVNPVGLLALLALPIIVILHLFRQRFRPRPIAGLFLWSSETKDLTGGRRLARLQNSTSLWLELLLATLLALYLAGPRFDRPRDTATLTIVLDGSASLSASDGATALTERVRSRVVQLLTEADRLVRVTLIVSGTPPRVLSGPGALAPEALQQLKTYAPSARSHSLAPAIDLARELAGPKGLVHVLTDRILGDGLTPGPLVRIEGLGRSQPNTALLGVHRARTDDPSIDRVFVRVIHYGSTDKDVDVSLRASGMTVAQRRVMLSPSQEERLSFDVTAKNEDIVVVLPPDALSIDNEALLTRPPLRVVHTRIDGLSAFVEERVSAALRAIPETAEASKTVAPEIVFTSPDGEVQDDALVIRIGSLFAGEDDRGQSLLGPFLMDRGHPLLEGVGFEGVVWAGIGARKTSLSPLVSSADKTLIGLSTGRPYNVWFNLNLEESNLHRTADWPVLISNLVSVVRNELPGADRVNVRIGETVTVRSGPKPFEHLTLNAPDGSVRDVVPAERVLLAGLEAPGLYTLNENDAVIGQVAVHFADPLESDLTSAMTGNVGGDAENTDAPSGGDVLLDPRLHFGLVLAAAMTLLLNAWWIRRNTTGVAQ